MTRVGPKTMRYCVLIVVFNEEKTVKELLRAVLTQRGITPKVVWVVSDGSTDRTDEIVRQIGKRSKLVRLVRNHRRIGKVASLVKAKRLVTGCDCVVMLDGDIEIRSNKLFERLLTAIDRQKEPGLVCGKVSYMKAVDSSGWLYAAREMDSLVISSMYKTYGRRGDNISGACMVAARDLLLKAELTFSAAEDYELYVWALKLGLDVDWVDSAVVYHPVPASILAGYSEYSRGKQGLRLITEKYRGQVPKLKDSRQVRGNRRIYYRQWITYAVRQPLCGLAWLGVRLVYKYWDLTAKLSISVSIQVDNYWLKSSEVRQHDG